MTQKVVNAGRSRGVGRLAQVVLCGLALACAGLSAPTATASDEAVSQVNALYATIAPAKRSDLVLLPLLKDMEAVPAAVSGIEQARLLPATSPAFAQASSWAQSAPQQAILEALTRVTQERNFREAYAFGQPYGFAGVSPDLVRAGLYTELGDPPTLSAAQHLYLPSLDRMEVLVNVEATRLAHAGNPSGAVELLTNFLFFGRQMCDRQFFAEAHWGLSSMVRTLERIRDIAYVDSRSARKLDLTKLFEEIERLNPAQGYLDLGRMKLPQGDRFGAEQVAARVYIPRGGVNPETFGPTMARIGASERPLRIFSEAARWRTAGTDQATQEETASAIRGIFSDWDGRWSFDWFDRRQSLRTQFGELDKRRYALLAVAVPDFNELAVLRQLVRVELSGTRTSLAVVGFWYATQNLPPVVSAVRPRWIQRLDDDPFNPDTRNVRGTPPLTYLVPARDTPRDAQGDPQPYEINIVNSDGTNFGVRLRDDTFLLYSRGSDLADNRALSIQNTGTVVQGADYLIWPPLVGLYRQHLIDRGDLDNGQ